MWITSINIKNFRCFESLSLAPSKGLNILVGENSAGKSAVFVAISKLFDRTQGDMGAFPETDLRYGNLGEGSEVKCELALDVPEQRQLLNSLLPGRWATIDSTKIYQRLTTALQNPEVTFEWQETDTHSYIKLGPMFVLPNEISDQVRRGGSTEELSGLFHHLSSSGNTLEFLLSKKDLWKSMDIAQRVGQVLSARFRSFAEFRARPSTSDRSDAVESFQGSETASVLLNLKNHHGQRQRGRYTTVCSEFSKFFPSLSIEAVETEPGSGMADIQLLEMGQDYPIPLDNVGAGVAEMLTLLTNLVAREGYVLVIEEPELHLHPQAKRQLHNLIRTSATKNQLFVLTHDPHFVDPEYLDALTRLWTTELGTQKASMPQSLSERERGQLKTAMKDVTKLELVFARALLLVEDESQKNIIVGFANTLRHDLDSSGVSVVSVDGQDGFPPFVKLAKALQIPYCCLRDKDWGSSSNRPPAVFRTLGCELEAYLQSSGLGPLMEKAKREVGDNKPRVAKYVGEHATLKQIPSLFSELITNVIELAKNK